MVVFVALFWALRALFTFRINLFKWKPAELTLDERLRYFEVGNFETLRHFEENLPNCGGKSFTEGVESIGRSRWPRKCLYPAQAWWVSTILKYKRLRRGSEREMEMQENYQIWTLSIPETQAATCSNTCTCST